MEIVEKKVGELKAYEKNPRKNDNAVEAVANSIREFGFKVPIVIDSNDVIVCGHTRLKAAIQLGMENVPCIIANDLTDEQIKAFRLADNKTAELATWDFSKLFDEIQGINLDMTDFGFPNTDQMLEGIFEEEEFEEEKEEDTKEDDLGYKVIVKCPDGRARDELISLLQEHEFDWSEK